MSVESSEALERSVLERKDREELLAIADALGVKPGSRARKADIVDKILQQTGVMPMPDAGAAPPARAARGRRPAAANVTQEVLPEAGDSDGADEAPLPDSRSEALGASAPRHAGRDEAGDDDGPATPTNVSGGQTMSVPPAGDAGADRTEALAPAPTGDVTPSMSTTPVGPARPVRSDASPSRPVERSSRRGGAPEPPAAWELEVRAPSTPPASPSRPSDRGEPGEPLPAPRFPGVPGVPEQGEGGARRRRRRGRDRERPVTGPGGGPLPGAPSAGPGPGQAPGQGQGQPQLQGQHDGQGGEPRIEEQVHGTGTGEPVEVEGYLDLRDEGYGFLRVHDFLPSRDDVYVSVKQTRQYGLRKGDRVGGLSRPAGRNEKNPALLRVDRVNDADPEQARHRPHFEDLTPLFPDSRLRLEDPADPFNMTARIIDLVAPIGKGQRGLIVSPPKAGKTTVMKTIAKAIEHNNPEVHLMVLLIDERPEEVTDMRRTVQGEVISSTFDRPADEHTHVAEMVIERAKRRVEAGEDVVIILDGITRLARAYNLAAPTTGRIMSGGIDTGALYPPKKFFGAARNIEQGGSLTILATALVDTGSRMDEVIFEEFKGTGNMELRLDRRMAERRIYPAIDVDASSTRHEELLFSRAQLQQVWKLRRVLSGLGDGVGGGLELLTDRLKTFKTNDEFLTEVARQGSSM